MPIGFVLLRSLSLDHGQQLSHCTLTGLLCMKISGIFSFSYKDISHWTRSPSLWPHLTLTNSLKSLSPSTVTLGVKASMYEFGGYSSVHNKLNFFLIIQEDYWAKINFSHKKYLLKKDHEHWEVWLSSLGIIPQGKRSSVWSSVRAHAWVVGWVPCGGWVRGNHILIFLSLFLSPFPSKNK